MSAPAFAIHWGSEKFIDSPFVRVGGGVGEKRIDLRGGWRDTKEIEVDASEKGAAVGFARRNETFRLEPSKDKSIDFVARPFFEKYGWKRGIRNRLVRPVRSAARSLVG
jgi:hypothetical protein